MIQARYRGNATRVVHAMPPRKFDYHSQVVRIQTAARGFLARKRNLSGEFTSSAAAAQPAPGAEQLKDEVWHHFGDLWRSFLQHNPAGTGTVSEASVRRIIAGTE